MAIETTAFSMIGTGRATNVLSDPMIGWIFPVRILALEGLQT